MIAIADGLNHSLALREDGAVWAWGVPTVSVQVSESEGPHGDRHGCTFAGDTDITYFRP
ncbi:RCC1-like domain-containing protein [Streptomyces sp. NPDC060000]|uniref:RCC1-like domain-containing protein n=1 Tax=Streptomyces sp. NPDC060000 TaxID=3347031 RepID=UPI00368F402D